MIQMNEMTPTLIITFISGSTVSASIIILSLVSIVQEKVIRGTN